MVINYITKRAVICCSFMAHDVKHFDTNNLFICMGIDMAKEYKIATFVTDI